MSTFVRKYKIPVLLKYSATSRILKVPLLYILAFLETTLGWTCWTGTWLCQPRGSLGRWATHPHTGCFHPSGIQSGIWEAWRGWGSLELTAGVQLLGKKLSRGWSRGWSRALGTRGSFGGCTNTRRFGWHTSCLLGRPQGWSGTHQHLQGHRKDRC